MPEKASREHVEMGGRNPKKNDYEGVGEKEEVPPEVKANYKGAANPFSKVFSLYPVPKVILHSP